MFEISENENQIVPEGAKIRVIGVGGGGCNAVNTMIKSGLSGVEYIVANTDSQALNVNLAPVKIQLGAEITKGLGAGANPEVGRKSALDEYEQLSEVLEGSDMVFITAGMGGGTGTGAAPVIAKLAKELGALTVGVVTKPFFFEGKKRMRQATKGIETLEENVDSLITIPNQRLLYLAGESLSLVDTFKKADEVLLNAVRGISDLINTTGNINADFADVCTVMANKGLALMGTGVCAGPDRAIKAATEAISSPLLEDISIDGATGIIVNITGSESLTMHEVNEAVMLIMEAADEDAEVIFGQAIDENLEDNIKVTVVATGLGGSKERKIEAPMQQQPMMTEQRMERPVMQAAPQVQPQMQSYERPVAQQHVQHEVKAQQTVDEFLAGGETVEAQRPVQHVEERSFNQAPVQENTWTQNVEAEVESNFQNVEPQREEQVSPLMQSIKDAATRYESTKTVDNQNTEMMHTSMNPGTASTQRHSDNSMNRAKSIAEKLGFVNFDEDELDTPTYLRKEESKEQEFQRPVNNELQ
ncbi:cell division protein FtsZ [Halobacteriovorax sp. GB3]|uniref:cell division protein FtsZ n=1 Tax=Halobacteriovorax sp. GB3 TaxID=2719615 RepID=UPI002361489F|nr:cell division protein FtsZ [Halobacteriovorax sp. GB3]MDD0854655.1 cell division protein FtsZ [Halobacteriovorax sp. GB3]